MWRSLPEFSNEETSYEDWKKTVVSEGGQKLKQWEMDCEDAWEFGPLGALKVFLGVFLGLRD
jgi:hypothetical protein